MQVLKEILALLGAGATLHGIIRTIGLRNIMGTLSLHLSVLELLRQLGLPILKRLPILVRVIRLDLTIERIRVRQATIAF